MSATRGPAPGDFDGFRQPAPAFFSPGVTGDRNSDGSCHGRGHGVESQHGREGVVSAYSTAAGEGAVPGQAFFYAGTRALLVSNWPVESVSARLLTTELFRQQEADPSLSRAVALQNSMLKLLDEGVCRDARNGKVEYAYGHPVFWAPFSLVGEGRQR